MLFNDYMAVGFSESLRLKIESGPPEMGLKDERSNQPRALRCLDRHGYNRTTGITGLWQPSVHSDVAF